MPSARKARVAARSSGTFYEFTVDAALLKELGERLVGKPHVALAELVKNAYDADATKVRITFESDAIEVIDNGDGMSKSDFKRFWMRIGTTHKQDQQTTERLKRQVSGSKGVGRLSVQFLGSTLKLWSVSRKSTSTAFRAEVDWHKAQAAQSLIKSGATLFSTKAKGALPTGFRHGTRVRIEGLNQEWDSAGLRGLARELWFLRPPEELVKDLTRKDRFEIELSGAAEAERKAFNEQLKKSFDNWIAVIEGSVKRGRSGGMANVKVTFADGETHESRYKLSAPAINEATYAIRIYKLSGKQAGGVSVIDAREYFKKFGGVHIYDQDFRLPFYGGQGEDWLRLEYDHSHRLMVSKLVPDELKGDGDLRDLPTNGRVFGVTRVSTNQERSIASADERRRGAYLNVQVTRDRFIENESMDVLRQFVRWGLDYYSYLSSARKAREMGPMDSNPVRPTEPVFDEIRQRLTDLASEVPSQAVVRLRAIEQQVQALYSIEQQREKRFHRERVLLGALATAGMGAIALEHELGKELIALRTAIADVKRLKSPTEFAQVESGLAALVDRISSARRLLSPLMDAENRDYEASLRAADVVSTIVADIRPLMRGIEVDLSGIDKDLRLPKATLAAWAAILQNVLINAVNASIDADEKKIRITSHLQANGRRASLRVQDCGAGVDLDTADELFEPFERKLEISDDRKRLGLGGVGLGLTIVKMVAGSIKCEVQFVEPDEDMRTAFEINWRTEDVEQVPDSHRRRRN